MPIGSSALLAPYDVHTLPARLDAAAAAAVERAARDSRGRVLILDFTEVTYIDAGGILGLTRAAGAAPERRMVLASLDAHATTIAQLTHLHDTFDIYASVDAAICALLDAATDEAGECMSSSTSAL